MYSEHGFKTGFTNDNAFVDRPKNFCQKQHIFEQTA